MKTLKNTLAFVAGTLLLISCSDSSKFNQNNLVGTWNMTSNETRDYATDTIRQSTTFQTGDAYLVFADNDTSTFTFLTQNTSMHYQVGSSNGKDLIVFSHADTMEVIRFTGTEMDMSSKIDKSNSVADNRYSVNYLTKQ